MRYTKEHKSDTRRRILEKASQRFRDEGVDSVGVASLMGSVGLTVGGFYSHFDSKEALVAEACEDGFSQTTARFRTFIEAQPKGCRLAALTDAYLSPAHRDHPGDGCFAAANGAEIARHPTQTRAAFTAQVNSWVGLIGEAMRADGIDGDPRAVAAALVGTMVLARAVDDAVLSDAYLASGREMVRSRLAGAQSSGSCSAVRD